MRLQSVFIAIAGPVSCVVLFWGWYYIAANYDYSALSGTYTAQENSVACVLTLKADATFSEERNNQGKIQHATGTWCRVGEGGVTFSPEFLRLPGQRSYADLPGSDASKHPETPPEFSGHFEKILTVYPELMLERQPNDIVLHRKLFP